MRDCVLTVRQNSGCEPGPQVLEFFDGFDLLAPGLVSVAQWRPEDDGGVPVRFSSNAGVGFK